MKKVFCSLALATLISPMAIAGNGDCPYANDNLKHAFGGPFFEGWPGSTAVWKTNGHLNLPVQGVVSHSDSSLSEKAVVEGGGLPFATPAGSKQKTWLRLSYDAQGRLETLDLRQGGVLVAKWAQTLSYKWNGSTCQLAKVTNKSPDLNGKEGVTFDTALCDGLKTKGLLDTKAIASCAELDEKLGTAIADYSAHLPNSQTFALYTTSPAGITTLKAYDRRDYKLVNAAVAKDCSYQMKQNSGPAAASAEGPSAGHSTPAN